MPKDIEQAVRKHTAARSAFITVTFQHKRRIIRLCWSERGRSRSGWSQDAGCCSTAVRCQRPDGGVRGSAGPISPDRRQDTGGWVASCRSLKDGDGRADFRGLCSFLLGGWRVDWQTDLLAPQLQACGGETCGGGQGSKVKSRA